MVQIPEVIRVAVMPATVQIGGVVEVKLTVRPEVAVAVRFTVLAAIWPAATAEKEIVWVARPTLKFCEIGVAAEYSAFPVWVAWMVQIPEVIREAVVPLTVQTC